MPAAKLVMFVQALQTIHQTENRQQSGYLLVTSASSLIAE
jgi:hypothetical protein